ncbi:MAG: TIR domain-containing protein [Chloroflexota bacterium]|nr:MAG: hypothetical protein DIU68_16365 [Chloroflexota bacterium]
MIDVFIAYAPADKGFARLLNEVLAKRGIITWVRWDDALPNADEWNEIQAAIEAADNILYIVSPEATESSYVRDVVEYAARHNKRFVPVIRRDLQFGSIHKAVRRYSLIYARDSEHFDSALHQIIRHINRDQPYIRMHTDLLVRSREWVLSGRKRRHLLRGKDLRAAEKWFIQSAGNHPKPVERQIEYIHASRRARDAGQRQALWLAGLTFVGILIVAGFTFSRLIDTPRAARPAAAETKNAVATGFARTETAGIVQTATVEAQLALLQTPVGSAQATRGSVTDEPVAGQEQRYGTLMATTSREAGATNALAADLEALQEELDLAVAGNQAMLAEATAAVMALETEVAVQATTLARAQADTARLQGTAVAFAEAATAAHEDHATQTAAALATEPHEASMTEVARLAREVQATLAAHEAEVAEARATAEAVQVALAAVENRASMLQSLVLAESAREALDADRLDLALALAVEANRVSNPPVEAQRMLGWLAFRPLARRAFAGHENIIYSVAISRDGERVASGSLDHTVRIWDAATGRELRQMRDHSGVALSLAFSPDGQVLAGGTQNGVIHLWDVETGALLADLEGHEGWVTGIDFSPDGTTLVSASQDRSIRLWDVASGDLIWRVDGHSNAVSSVEFSPDGEMILSSGRDGMLRLWSAATGDNRHVFGTQRDMLRDATFMPDGRHVIDSALRIWDISTGEMIARFEEGPVDGVQSLDVSPDGRFLVTASFNDPRVHVWNLETRSLYTDFVGHSDAVVSVGFAANSRYIVSGAWDTMPRLWDVDSLPLTRHFEVNDTPVIDLALSAGGRLVAAALGDAGARVWDATTGGLIWEWNDVESATVAIAFGSRPSGIVALGGLEDGSLRLWDVNSGRPVYHVAGHQARVTGVAFSPDGAVAVSGAADGALRLWNVSDGSLIRAFNGPAEAITGVAVSPNGRYIASAAAGGAIRLWDIETGQELRVFAGHDDAVRSLAFSPDGRTLVSASDDATIRLWDVADGRELATLTGYAGAVTGVSFSPDGSLILSGGEDGTVRLWDAASGSLFRLIESPAFDLTSLVWSPNGQHALLALRDSGPALLRLHNPRELVDWTLENRYVAPLTCEERVRYYIEPRCDANDNLPAPTATAPALTPAASPETVSPSVSDTPIFTPTTGNTRTPTATPTATTTPTRTAEPTPSATRTASPLPSVTARPLRALTATPAGAD